MAFADDPQRYVLSRDSQVADEYWLQLAEGGDSRPTVLLFRSRAMSAWLERHGIGDLGPIPETLAAPVRGLALRQAGAVPDRPTPGAAPKDAACRRPRLGRGWRAAPLCRL